MKTIVKTRRGFTGHVWGLDFRFGKYEGTLTKEKLEECKNNPYLSVIEIPKYASGKKAEYLIQLTNFRFAGNIRGVEFKDGCGITLDKKVADIFALEHHSVTVIKPKPAPKKKSAPKKSGDK